MGIIKARKAKVAGPPDLGRGVDLIRADWGGLDEVDGDGCVDGRLVHDGSLGACVPGLEVVVVDLPPNFDAH